ncbi:hypothetical protein JOE53_001603 [Microbacterium laevaniformans]|nr:hypothetical protein [Microbacterium laevaniformans]
MRFTRRWGPHRIAYHLGLARSTVGRVLARYGMPKLVNIDQATGLPVRKPTPKRYEVARPGQLIHVDIKKQGRIPDGGGWRAFAAHGLEQHQDDHRDEDGRRARALGIRPSGSERRLTRHGRHRHRERVERRRATRRHQHDPQQRSPAVTKQIREPRRRRTRSLARHPSGENQRHDSRERTQPERDPPPPRRNLREDPPRSAQVTPARG